MIKLSKPLVKQGDPDVGIISLDLDADAESVLITDRDDHYLIYLRNLISGQSVRVRVPIKYATTNRVYITMFDNDLEYAPAIVDGVQAQLIKASEF
jgi:hypothetical protein